eukprot:1195722-Prorocentrum_minimum.AAC.5
MAATRHLTNNSKTPWYSGELRHSRESTESATLHRQKTVRMRSRKENSPSKYTVLLTSTPARTPGVGERIAAGSACASRTSVHL